MTWYTSRMTSWRFWRSSRYDSLARDSEDGQETVAFKDSYESEQVPKENEILVRTYDKQVGQKRSRIHQRMLFLSVLLNIALIFAFISRSFLGPSEDLDKDSRGVSLEHPLREAPEFPSRLISYEQDPRYMGDSPEIDATWQKLWPRTFPLSITPFFALTNSNLTEGKGFVKAAGRHDDVEDYYVVAAFHQFHCVVSSLNCDRVKMGRFD